MPRETLLDFFLDLASEQGEFLVYDDGYRTWTRSYAEVARAARAFAARLRAHGIGKGDKVVFWLENCPEWVAALWGCLLEGVIAVPVDYRSSSEFLTRITSIVEARLVLTAENALSEIEWAAREHDAASPVAVGAEDIAEIVFTSGATAEPKGVLITHRNLLSNLVPVEREIKKYRKWGRPFYPSAS